jgi:thiamine transport system ATP-binding protein
MGSLDRALREDLVVELGSILRTTGTTTLVVTHDHTEATTIADRLVILDDGRIVQHGAVSEVLAHPVDAHVARLLGRAQPDGGG